MEVARLCAPGFDLISLEAEWTRALVRRDGTTFDRRLAPQFVHTENDQVMNKAELINGVVAGRTRWSRPLPDLARWTSW